MPLPPPLPALPAEQPATDARRARLHQIVFEADTPAGRAFDLLIIGAILASIALVSLETVGGLPRPVYRWLRVGEWTLTLLFTVEYALRLYAVRQPLRYARSFFGVVDLLALLPTYLSLVVPGGHYLLTVRALRLLRIFRVLKLSRFLSEAHGLRQAIRASLHKISVFLLTVATIVVIVGSVMYLVEGEANGFTSIPRGMYWAVVTLTTVGYGDVAPRTPLGQTLAAFVMILGYGIIAVPTGIVTAELTLARTAPVSGQACPSCGTDAHFPDARFCRRCGSPL